LRSGLFADRGADIFKNMMNQNRKKFGLTWVLGSLLILSACASTKYQDYRYFKSIGITHNIHAVENAGMVRSEDCQFTLLGYSVQGAPSFEDALENAVGLESSSFQEGLADSVSSRARLMKTNVRMMTNLQLREEGWNLGIVGRRCLKLSAVAYK
jgi:hypothetical protein